MSHDYHETLEGFHPDQLLHDGCAECEHRAEDPFVAIGNLDAQNFERAWQRAKQWQKDLNMTVINSLSEAELPMLRLLWAVQVQLERRGVPIGHVPGLEVHAGW